MEAWTVVFRNLYTGFLLRDFAGKIVPGMFLLFSISAMFRAPREIIADFKKDIPIFVVLLIAGFAWTVTLGTQSLAEGLGIWRYFPVASAGASANAGFRLKNIFVPSPDKGFDADTLQVDEFQSKASEDEKQQYERFVVIKEACGNLFVAGILSIPAWLFRMLLSVRQTKSSGQVWHRLQPYIRAFLSLAYVFCIFIGLHRMHAQHVYRQLKFAQDISDKHKNSSSSVSTPGVPTKP